VKSGCADMLEPELQGDWSSVTSKNGAREKVLDDDKYVIA